MNLTLPSSLVQPKLDLHHNLDLKAAIKMCPSMPPILYLRPDYLLLFVDYLPGLWNESKVHINCDQLGNFVPVV